MGTKIKTSKRVDMKDSPQQAEFYRQLGENIRRHRKRLDLSQDELARSIGLTRTSLTNIENGRQHPPLHTFSDIVEQLKVDPSELLPRTTVAVAADVEVFVAQQTRDPNERAFVATGIGLKTEEKANGDTKKEDRGARTVASDGERDNAGARAGVEGRQGKRRANLR